LEGIDYRLSCKLRVSLYGLTRLLVSERVGAVQLSQPFSHEHAMGTIFLDASKCVVSLKYLILPPSSSMIFAATKAAEINHNGDKQNQ
jgi:hypothetical protein